MTDRCFFEPSGKWARIFILPATFRQVLRLTGWWPLKYFFMFIPDPWGNDPIRRSYFSDGLNRNHQLVDKGSSMFQPLARAGDCHIPGYSRNLKPNAVGRFSGIFRDPQGHETPLNGEFPILFPNPTPMFESLKIWEARMGNSP